MAKKTSLLIINTLLFAGAMLLWPIGLLEPVRAHEGQIPGRISDVVKKATKINNEEIAPLAEGVPITRQVETEIEPELVIGGAIYIEAPLSFIRERFNHNIPMNHNQAAVESGIFRNPPQWDDLQGLSIDESDIEAFRTCQVKECNIKLPASAIEYFCRAVEFSDPEYARKADSLYRRFLLERAAAYMTQGVAGMVEYHDQSYPLIQADEFLAILKSSKLIDTYDGRLRKYLKEFPAYKMDGICDLFVWSKEIYDALRPLITLNHISVYEKKGHSREFMVTRAQFYASHYYESSLEIALIMADDNEEMPGAYYIYLKRARFDTLRKPDFWGVKKSRLRTGVEQGVKELLAAVKQETETAYQAFRAGQE